MWIVFAVKGYHFLHTMVIHTCFNYILFVLCRAALYRVFIMSIAAQQSGTSADAVPARMRHETDDQYKARVNVYRFYISKYGEEEADTLSMVFSNMKYMHCRYPAAVESKLADCPGTCLELTSLTNDIVLRSFSILTCMLLCYFHSYRYQGHCGKLTNLPCSISTVKAARPQGDDPTRN